MLILLPSANRKYHFSHCYNIFRSCVSEVVVPSYTVGFRYISREGWVLCFLLLCSLMICANDRAHYGPVVVYGSLLITLLHHRHHHYADLSEDIKLLKNLPYTLCLECVSETMPFSQLPFM